MGSLGVSVYPDLRPLDEIGDYLRRAARHGAKRVYTVSPRGDHDILPLQESPKAFFLLRGSFPDITGLFHVFVHIIHPVLKM